MLRRASGYFPVIPSLSAPSDRDKRCEKRDFISEKAAFEENQRVQKIDTARFNEDRIKELEDELKAHKQQQLQGAMSQLDKLNPGNAHTNFHGMADTAKAFDVNRNTLRKHYIERRSVVYDALPAFPDMESAIVDPDIFLRKLVDSCVTGIEKPFTVWTKNKEELQRLHCGKTAFADWQIA